LLGLLFSGARGPALFGCGVLWLILTAVAIFLVMWIKSKLSHGLERCVAKANQQLIRHNIILGVDDRGKLSCQKTHLCFIYFDTADCVKKLQSIIEAEENVSQAEANPEEQRRRTEFHSRMDIDDSDIVVTGANTTRISRKQEKARMLLLRYSQRWAKALSRNSLDLQLYAAQVAALATETAGGGQSTSGGPTPRHCATAQCLCQFIELHLYKKVHPDKQYTTPCWKLPSFGFK